MLDWPPYLPDLNPIENLWSVAKSRFAKEYTKLATMPSNNAVLTKLIETVEDIWEGIEIEMVNSLIDSIPRRLKALFDAKGWYTKY